MSESLIEIIPLFSGSSGNSIFLQFGQIRILVDVGRSCKQLTEALEDIGQAPESIDAIFITHAHSDHLCGLDVFVRKYGIDIYATEKTWPGIFSAQKKAHPATLDHVVTPLHSLKIGDVEVLPFPTPHDMPGSVGYRFSSFGRSFSVVTDLGHFSEEVKNAIVGSEAVLIEANYNESMLINGPYPWMLKKRVGGQTGHLCNSDCAQAIEYLYRNGTRHIILGHLSQENNSPSVAKKEIETYLHGVNIRAGIDLSLQVARRFVPSEPLRLFCAQDEVTGQQICVETCPVLNEMGAHA